MFHILIQFVVRIAVSKVLNFLAYQYLVQNSENEIFFNVGSRFFTFVILHCVNYVLL